MGDKIGVLQLHKITICVIDDLLLVVKHSYVQSSQEYNRNIKFSVLPSLKKYVVKKYFLRWKCYLVEICVIL